MQISNNAADVIIIGAGPAGLSAAVWCHGLGLKTLLIEKEDSFGGQLANIHNPITNYLGVACQNGQEMLEHFRETFRVAGAIPTVRAEVRAVDVGVKLSRVILDNGSEASCRALVVGTGVRRRRLGIPGEEEFRGKGIVESGARDRESLRGKRVLVVGGGDAALENTLVLSDVASSVKLAFRRAKPTARPEFRTAIGDRNNIEVLPQTILKEVTGDSAITAVKLENCSTGVTWTEQTDGVLIRIGVEPNSELFRNVLDMDARGYILVDSSCRTSRAAVFGVGDVANPTAPTISSAVGMGATAAKAISYFLTNERDV